MIELPSSCLLTHLMPTRLLDAIALWKHVCVHVCLLSYILYGFVSVALIFVMGL